MLPGRERICPWHRPWSCLRERCKKTPPEEKGAWFSRYRERIPWWTPWQSVMVLDLLIVFHAKEYLLLPFDKYYSKVCMRQREFGGLKIERQELKCIFSGCGYVSDSDASSLSRWVFLWMRARFFFRFALFGFVFLSRIASVFFLFPAIYTSPFRGWMQRIGRYTCCIIMSSTKTAQMIFWHIQQHSWRS